MAKPPRMDLTTFVGKLLERDDIDALREGVRILVQAVMDIEVSGQIGALPYERSFDHTAHRSSFDHTPTETVTAPAPGIPGSGPSSSKIPKVTRGSYFPSLLEPRRRAERALHAVVVEAYVKGVSIRKVDDLVKALGIDGISKSKVSRLCKVLDSEVEAFRNRPIDDHCPYVILDATFHETRELDRVISDACVVTVGVTTRESAGCWAWIAVPARTRLSGRAFCAPSSSEGSGRAPGRVRRPRGSPGGDRQGVARHPVAEIICSHCSWAGGSRLSPTPTGEGLASVTREVRRQTCPFLPSVAGSSLASGSRAPSTEMSDEVGRACGVTRATQGGAHG